MPVIVTRHGMVDNSTLQLNPEGSAYANRLASLLQADIPNVVPLLGGFYADPDPALNDKNYKRCFETILPLADAAGYSIAPLTGTGVQQFQEMSGFFSDPKKYGVLCLRLEDGINPLRATFKLAPLDSPCAYGFLALLTPNSARPGGWQWRSIPTRQPSNPTNCASDSPPR